MRALESFKWFKLVLSLFLIKTWCFASYGSFAYKYILSISGWWLIRLNNEFVFFRSRASSYFCFVWMIKNWWPIWIIFFCVFFYNIIKVKHFLYCFIVLLLAISSFSLTRSLLVQYAYVSIETIDYILLPSFELKAILLVSSVKTLWL